ncbi:MAG: amidase [Candidatus Hydrogenedentota bacterium]
MENSSDTAGVNRRRFLSTLSGFGLGSVFGSPPSLAQEAPAADTHGEITAATISEAEMLFGLTFTEDERKQMLGLVKRMPVTFAEFRKVPLPNSVAPALQFNPLPPGFAFEPEHRPFVSPAGPPPAVPSDLEKAAFWSVADLGRAIKARAITSEALTRMYLARLKRYDPVLKCVITLTEDLAFKQAQRADADIAAGKYRSPLHGIPWGAKDLLAVKGYPTTWGAEPYRDQRFDEDATVARKLEEAGAVLVAKLSLGALAQGDEWFGGRTNSPWDPKRGSSGSSAGPGAATAGGLVAFAIGSETNGSITSPATVNGVTGLRPTYGRVSRHGAMALSWSMDKLGPLCRTAEDCAIVLNAIIGPDGKDPMVIDAPFNWDPARGLDSTRVGYVKSAFDEQTSDSGNGAAALTALRGLGLELREVTLPDYPITDMMLILFVEAAAAFDELTRSDRDDLLSKQGATDWPNTFRRARLIPAVEYIQANRIRSLIIQDMARLFQEVDVIVLPTMHKLVLGNYTGHPIASVPSGFNERGAPTSIGIMGRLFGEADLLAVAKAYQEATGHHLKHPELQA